MKSFILLMLLASMVVNAATPIVFTDSRDKRKYQIVQIETQVWMAENLAYNTKESTCYDGKKENCKKAGRLYNFEEAQTACPAGWHLPSQMEFNLLRTYAGRMTAGNKLKDTTAWKFLCDEDMSLAIACPMDEQVSLFELNDELGFSAKPFGYCQKQEQIECSEQGNATRFWTTSEDEGLFFYELKNDSPMFKYTKVQGEATPYFSVRCIKD